MTLVSRDVQLCNEAPSPLMSSTLFSLSTANVNSLERSYILSCLYKAFKPSYSAFVPAQSNAIRRFDGRVRSQSGSETYRVFIAGAPKTNIAAASKHLEFWEGKGRCSLRLWTYLYRVQAFSHVCDDRVPPTTKLYLALSTPVE